MQEDSTLTSFLIILILLYTLGRPDWRELLYAGPCPGKPKELRLNHHSTLAFAWRSSDEGALCLYKILPEIKKLPLDMQNSENDQKECFCLNILK